MNISNMSNRELEALAQDIFVELQERDLRVNCEDALNHHLGVDEVESVFSAAEQESQIELNNFMASGS